MKTYNYKRLVPAKINPKEPSSVTNKPKPMKFVFERLGFSPNASLI